MTKEMNDKLNELRHCVLEHEHSVDGELKVPIDVLKELLSHNAALFEAMTASHRYFLACAMQYMASEKRSETGAKIVGGDALDVLSDHAGDVILRTIEMLRCPG